MLPETKLAKCRLSVLELAEQLGNVSEAWPRARYRGIKPALVPRLKSLFHHDGHDIRETCHPCATPYKTAKPR